MSNINEQIEEVELTIEQAQELVDRQRVFQNLRNNKDFKEIIEKGYFEEESKRLVLLLADPNVQEKAAREMIEHKIRAIGELFQYFIRVNTAGLQAQQDILGAEDAREEMLEEALDA